jgi:hypothetical protein
MAEAYGHEICGQEIHSCFLCDFLVCFCFLRYYRHQLLAILRDGDMKETSNGTIIIRTSIPIEISQAMIFRRPKTITIAGV